MKINEILVKEHLSDLVWRYRIYSPRIAQKRQAGQFIIFRVEENGERIPLTIVTSDSSAGWIEIIFQVVGHTTQQLAQLVQGDVIIDLVGPLGKPTHIEKFGHCLCLGGGVGVAALYPIVVALKNAGNKITTIIGARNEKLLLLEKELQKISDVFLTATDDGSKGHHGFVADVFKSLKEKFDFAIVVGPAIMMKITTQLTVAAGIKTYASLNPIMVDGTGMCGCCRVTVDNKTQFVCVDGPEFDAKAIDWDSLIQRLNSYREFEQKAFHQCRLEGKIND